MNNKVRKSFCCSAINHFLSLLTDLGRTCSFICIRPKWSACVERIDTSWHLDCSVCDSSRHSQEPSGEAFNAMYRQETHTDNTWIILNHALISARKNVSGGSFILIMYRSVTQLILHYCVIALYVCCKWLSALLSCHLMWPWCCLLSKLHYLL